MWSSRNASPLWWRSFKRNARKRGIIYIPLVIVLETNYVAFWIDNLSSAASLTVVCPSLPWTSFSTSTSPCADAFLLNILRASGSVPALSLVFPLVRCCRTPRPNSFAKLCNAFLCRSFPLRARFLVHIFLKVYSCRATFEAIPVLLDPAFSVWGPV